MPRVGVLFELQGHRDLAAQLERVSDAIRDDVAEAVRDTAIAITRHAQTLAPKDRGDLRASISFQGKGLNWRVGILDRSLPSRGGRNTAHLNPWVYGVWYEFGFVTRNIAAQPFINPAAKAQDGPHEARIAAALNGGLARAA